MLGFRSAKRFGYHEIRQRESAWVNVYLHLITLHLLKQAITNMNHPNRSGFPLNFLEIPTNAQRIESISTALKSGVETLTLCKSRIYNQSTATRERQRPTPATTESLALARKIINY